ncbi:MAG TPA: cupin domain-containing protein [Rhodanobacteraceae bacterium]|nr:cupin domain-containing protein [Rhodanobacteraceae bacterium]
MPKLDIEAVRRRTGTSYPAPFDQPCLGRVRRELGNAGGLTDFGVNVLELQPGTWSSQRHWHSDEDEFVWILAGEVVLVEDGGETTLRAGDCAAFAKNSANGHHLVNRSSATATVLEVGSRSADDVCTYSDIDMRIDAREDVYTHQDGTPYPAK